MTRKTLLFVLCITLVSTLMLGGCSSMRRPYGIQNGYSNMDQNGGMNTSYGENSRTGITGMNNRLSNNGVPGSRNGANPNIGSNVGYRAGNQDAMRADQISTALKQIKGVENATVVVSGNTAYVGLTLARSLKNTNQGNIEKEAAQMVRSTNRDISTVYVSTEAGFMDRLRGVGEGIRNGRAIDTFTTELNEMVRRITPTRW